MSVTLRKVTEGDLKQIMRWRMDPEIKIGRAHV